MAWLLILPGFIAGGLSALTGFTPRKGFALFRSHLPTQKGIRL